MSIRIFPLRVRFSYPENNRPGRYSGSAWRGAFGHALKKLVCIFKHGHCETCPLKVSCAYTLIFESHLTADAVRGIPSPYTLYPVCEKDELHLHMSIIGKAAISFFPFILHALRVAGEQGVAHRAFGFEAVERFDEGMWKPMESQPVALPAMMPMPPQLSGQTLHLQLITPVRFKHQGHFVTPDTLTLELWIRALRRRLISLAASWGDESAMRQLCAVDEAGEWCAPDLRWQETERYSSRQKTSMKIGGVVGAFDLTAAQAHHLWPMLWLGQWTHIGKMTTMGMGRYEMMALKQEEAG